MPGENNDPRGSSASPSGDKDNVTNGGVKLPANGVPSNPTHATTASGEHEAGATGASSAPAVVPNGEGKPSANTVNGRTNTAAAGTSTSVQPGNGVPALISFLNRNSTADIAADPCIVSSSYTSPDGPQRDKGKGKAVQEPIGTRGANYSPTRPRVWFTTDVGPNSNPPGGHYIMLTNVVGKQVNGTMKALNDSFGWKSKVIGSYCPTPSGYSGVTELYLRFDNVHDASHAFEQVETVDPSLGIRYISQTEYAAAKLDTDNGTPDKTSFYDGQVIFMCEFKGLSHEFVTQGLEDAVHQLAKEAGEILVLGEKQGDGSKVQYRIEFCKITSAKAVVQKVTKEDPASIGKWIVFTVELSPLIVQSTPPSKTNLAITGPVDTPHSDDAANVQFTSPTGRTAWKLDANGNTVPMPPPRTVSRVKTGGAGPSHTPMQSHSLSEPSMYTPPNYMAPPMAPRSMSWAGPSTHAGPSFNSGFTPQAAPSRFRKMNFIPDGPNKIYPWKIRNGTDVRTSIMLRNIPNEMTYKMLKSILDAQGFGRYDFSYLRIDFNNNKNVGYGFVNFIDALDILPFYDEYYGKPWLPFARYNRRYGPRIADISYATIQGLDCLIEKMRNSSVMDENRDYRPKLWWTVETAPNDSMIGEEKAFPGVNNPSKKQRSRDNATQIGLYSSGSRGRRNNQHGGHQSQFDRGTTAQIQEEAFFNQQMMPMHDGYATPNYMLAGAPNGMMMAPPPPFPQMHGLPVEGYYAPHAMAPVAPGPFAMPGMDPFTVGYAPFQPINVDYAAVPQGHVDPRFIHPNQGFVYPIDAANNNNNMPAIPEETGEHNAAIGVKDEPDQQQSGTDQAGSLQPDVGPN